MGRGNLLGLLGICRKAGKLKLGFDPVADSLGKEACLLLFSSDISPKTKERMRKKADGLSVAAIDIDETSDDIWRTIGKRVAVMAVTDRGLAEQAALLNAKAQSEKRPTENHDEEDTNL